MGGVLRLIKVISAIVATVASLAAGEALAAGFSPAVHRGAAAAPPPVAACTQDVLRVTFATAYSPALQGYGVTDVSIVDTAPLPDLGHCAGQRYQVTLLGAGGAALGVVTGVVPTQEATFSPAGFPAPVDATAVTGVALAIGG